MNISRQHIKEVKKTFREELDEQPYEVDFMTIVVDKADDLKVVDFDSHFAEFTGVHPSKIKQGKLSLYDRIKPADRERIIQAICKKNARFIYIDMDLLDEEGNPVFVHCTGQNIEDTTLCRMTFADVSKSRAKQQLLQEKATEMHDLIDFVHSGICLFRVSPDMHIDALYLNNECCRLFGTSKESYVARTYRLDEFMHPDDRSTVYQAIGKSMAVNEPMDVECRVRVHKDEYVWCKVSAGIQRYDEDDCPVFHAVFTDITRAKEAEKKADDESERLVRLFKNLPGPVFTAQGDDPLKLDLVSEDFIKFIGYSRTELFDLFGGNLARFMQEQEAEDIRQQMLVAAKDGNIVIVKYSLQTGSLGEITVCDSRKIITQPDGSQATVGILSVV